MRFWFKGHSIVLREENEHVSVRHVKAISFFPRVCPQVWSGLRFSDVMLSLVVHKHDRSSGSGGQ